MQIFKRTVCKSRHRIMRPVNAEPIHSGARASIAINLPNASSARRSIDKARLLHDDVSKVKITAVYLWDIPRKWNSAFSTPSYYKLNSHHSFSFICSIELLRDLKNCIKPLMRSVLCLLLRCKASWVNGDSVGLTTIARHLCAFQTPTAVFSIIFHKRCRCRVRVEQNPRFLAV